VISNLWPWRGESIKKFPGVLDIILSIFICRHLFCTVKN